MEAEFVQFHGKLGASYGFANPQRTIVCEDLNRPEYTKIASHEYRDTEEVLLAKVKLFAELLQQAKNCVVYSGAGLSVASGLDDYATKSSESRSARPHVSDERGSGFLAHPNPAHIALARLQRGGYIKRVVNQNHDCLLQIAIDRLMLPLLSAQKAGFPQHAINEIHGSWFDPSNPGGNILRDDLFEDLLELEKTTDLSLALGTSLSGADNLRLNADRLCTTPAKKYPKKGLGLVIVNLQATQLDSICTLRIFAPLERVLALVSTALNLPPMPEVTLSGPSDQFDLPYDGATGKRSTTKTCHLDLRPGARVKILVGSFAGCSGVMGTKNAQGNYNLQVFSPVEGEPDLIITNDQLLGSWWFVEASQALIPLLPVVQEK